MIDSSLLRHTCSSVLVLCYDYYSLSVAFSVSVFICSFDYSFAILSIYACLSVCLFVSFSRSFFHSSSTLIHSHILENNPYITNDSIYPPHSTSSPALTSTDAILFTCSAFGCQLRSVKAPNAPPFCDDDYLTTACVSPTHSLNGLI